MPKLPEKLKELLENQAYGFTGEHSAVKICTWTKKSLRDEDVCYKQKFYGIRSHLCAQMSPSIGVCSNRCIFCWRDIDNTVSNEMKEDDPYLDDPKNIIDNCIEQQRRLLVGFFGNEKANKEKLEESRDPKHFAISLTGEPTAYPKINELIKEIHSRGCSTFLVTNGQLPEKLKDIEPPTQLYISVDAPNEELFKKIDHPQYKDGWQKLLQSLDILKELKDKTRTTLRITLIKELNMEDEKGYADLISLSQPLFLEIKAYMFVGSSRQRLDKKNMPRHNEVREFAEKIAELSNYQIIDEKEESRVVLLAKEDTEDRVMKFD